MQRINIYQALPRLFGNKITTNKPWGMIQENGAGKFNDFSDEALLAIKDLGITHIWYTGVLHHAMAGDYTMYGIGKDNPSIVKGRAGSPYAVKDYYSVDPDLAVDPARRMEEFEAMISRTHRNGLKVIIDLVPNHVARNYHSVGKPLGVTDFGEDDDNTVAYAKHNNFYYIPGESFILPDFPENYQPLGGEEGPLTDSTYDEFPARWTGNSAAKPKPDFTDWYETVKINFGVRPDGTCDFERMPCEYKNKDCNSHREFWNNKDTPATWKKFRDIAIFWLEKGVDGFRYDMAEMVPVEFWSYLNSYIKCQWPDSVLIAEIYKPELYRDFIFMGKMDFLYDKVGLYDTLRGIMEGYGSTDDIVWAQNSVLDIEQHMLHFLENHDEQRIASNAFAGRAEKGKPAMVVSACIGSSPVMVYFGQEVGEPAQGNAGFGSESRTSIFDYWGVPHHQRWMNFGTFDGGLLTSTEIDLRGFYKKLLNLNLTCNALSGSYYEIHSFNRGYTEWYNDKVFSFVRWSNNDRLIIVVNFSDTQRYGFELGLPVEIVRKWNLGEGTCRLKELLYNNRSFRLKTYHNSARVRIDIDPLESFILQIT